MRGLYRRGAALVACCVTLSACGGSGSDSPPSATEAASTNIQPSSDSGAPSTSAAPNALSSPVTVSASGSSGNASSAAQRSSAQSGVTLALAGIPAESVGAGRKYSFLPRTSGASNGALTFSIENRPSWAAFDSATGLLSGTPSNTNAGMYSDVVISVTDGMQRVALAPFSITVVAAAADANAPPPQAVAVGYTVHTFDANFTSSTVDITNSGKPGFLWYPYALFGRQAKIAAIKLNQDGSVTLAGDTSGPNGEITSARPVREPPGFVGTAFGGGAYLEAVFNFNPNDVAAAGSKGWPSFWSLAAEASVLYNGANQWKGQVSGYEHQIEYDFFEYLYLPYRVPRNVYSSAMHEWFGVRTVTCKVLCVQSTPGTVSKRAAPASTDFTQFHRYGYLWVPATTSAEGYARAYFDDEPIGMDVRWSKFTDQPPTPAGQPWAFGVMDEQHLVLILGTGVNEPMTVESVNVWQASDAKNLHH